MDRPTTTLILREGVDVVGAEGDKVGKVIGVGNDSIVVEKGFFFPIDYTIPTSAIARLDGDGKVYLNVTKDEALKLGWQGEPEVDMGASEMQYGASGGAVSAAERAAEGSIPGSPALGTTSSLGESPSSPDVAADLTDSGGASSDDGA
jgi:hypothetical protein